MKYIKPISIGLISFIIGIFIGYFLFNKTNSTSKNEVFERTIKCQDYLEDLKERAYNGYNFTVFYSPREDSCLGAYRSMIGTSLSLQIEDIFNPHEKFSYYHWENGSGSLVNSLFKKSRCSDLDNESKDCNIEDYEDLVNVWNNEIEWLKGN